MSNTYGNAIEANKRTAIITYGRFNPPTIGHKAMINRMLEVARGEDADPYIIVSHSQNSKKNPLFIPEKIHILRRMVPEESEVRILHTTKQEPFILKMVEKLLKNGYESIKMIMGSDRVEDFQKLFKNYPMVVVESGGERNMNSNTLGSINTVSASKVREAAVSGNRATFRSGMNTAIPEDELDDIFTVLQERLNVPLKKTTGKRTRGGAGKRKTRRVRK
jgi:nicotinic acid mononucleotide adenylyltransferase